MVLAVGYGVEFAIDDAYATRLLLRLNFTVEPGCCIFGHLLEKHELGKKLLEALAEIFEEQHRIMHEGSIVIVTIIPAPSLAKRASGARDPEMRQMKKPNQWYYGMKVVHVDVDAGHDRVARPRKESERAKVEHPLLSALTPDHQRPARQTPR